ncbi:conserved hypothetical protein [Ricinus communis]|uniref:Uncharacterized protein n=1 Tax=Ricinus communis TaxID=3988 RepID=B9TEB9_RICCO|nr:conserved hypothetical protein [Ricinus communis]
MRVVGLKAGAVHLDRIRARLQPLQVDAHRLAVAGRLHGRVETTIAASLLWRLEVPRQHLHATAILGRVALRIGGPERRVAQLIQAEAALERRGRRARLLKQIAIGPVAHALRNALGGFELAQDVRRADVRVVHRIAWRVAGAPLGEVQRHVGMAGFRHLAPHLAHVADDGVRRRRELGVVLAVLVEEATIHTVGMRGDEVHHRPGRSGMRQEFRHPRRTGG